MTQEKVIKPRSGWGMLVVEILAVPIGVALFIYAVSHAERQPVPLTFGLVLGATLIEAFAFISLFGFQAVAPNQARVLLLFGVYKGSIVDSGFYWVNPFYSKKKISLRVRNFETGSTETAEQKDSAGKIVQPKTRSAGRPSKVNDRDGNPIEISAVVVWKVVDTAEAVFEVDDYEHFVAVQSEAALRNLAAKYPYDSEDHETS
ncbi:MAG: SPFH domain-containing protein, partial [Planctomycetota bacterium]